MKTGEATITKNGKREMIPTIRLKAPREGVYAIKVVRMDKKKIHDHLKGGCVVDLPDGLPNSFYVALWWC